MTQFQLFSGAVFVAIMAVAYRAELFQLAKKLLGSVPRFAAKPSIAVGVVNELVAITQLRDKLAAEGCAEGVDACTNLMRVIIEQTKPVTPAV